ncbi:unnamed protein product, partial [Choristocarpus tenellus]
RYVYQYLEILCANVCTQIERRGGGGGGLGRREYTKLKSLVSLMQKAATHPSLVNLIQVSSVQCNMREYGPLEYL